MPFNELWPQVSRPRGKTGTSRGIAGDLLAGVTGLPEARLAQALIELRQPEPDWLAWRTQPQPGCLRCNARHPGGQVLQLLPHHRYVCTRHGLWIGPPDVLSRPYHRLDELPEVIAAQRAHLRLLRRLGPAATFDAVLTGFLICAHRWDDKPTGDTDAWHQWTRRVDLLIPPGTEQTTFSVSRLFAATYPEAVKIGALIGSLHWRRLAAGDPDDQLRFAAEIGRRLGQPDYRPLIGHDPISHWIEQDCWRPPSLPTGSYRTMRAFGGGHLPKHREQSLSSHRRSAHWFGLNRKAGQTMLHHRNLGAVLIRDWSQNMELFAGAVIASGETTVMLDRAVKRMTVKQLSALEAGEYLRPEPAISDYLDTAVSPAPWPQAPTPRHPRTSRPRLPREPGYFARYP